MSNFVGDLEAAVESPKGCFTPAAFSTSSDLLQLMGADQAALGDLAIPVPVRRQHVGETLFNQGARVETVHFVRSGSFKIFYIEHDGYEQVLGFAGRTDMLGFDALSLDAHPNSAVALEDSTTFMLRVADLYEHSKRAPAFAHTLHILLSRALARQQEQSNVMAAVSVEARLARFLLQLSSRVEADGQPTRSLLLRMSRRDIASYLGVVNETISRTLKMMTEWGLLSVDNRHIEILDVTRLQAFAQGARRQPDGGQGARKRLGVALGSERRAEATRPARPERVRFESAAGAFGGTADGRITAGAPIGASL